MYVMPGCRKAWCKKELRKIAGLGRYPARITWKVPKDNPATYLLCTYLPNYYNCKIWKARAIVYLITVMSPPTQTVGEAQVL
jgi:hypothetical protein